MTHEESYNQTDPEYKAVFNVLFGSWFGDWDMDRNLLRTVLASKGAALATCWGGEPQWFVYPMGLGETIGASLTLAQNQQNLYEFSSRTHGIAANLLGDPTVRMHVVKPPKNIAAQTLPLAAGRWITWTHSDDSTSPGFLGYHVYRSTSPDGPFVRVTNDYVTETSYTDAFTTIGQHTYMVRAIKKETTPSGTYINASTGVFVQTTGAKVLLPRFLTGTDQSVTVQFDRDVSSSLSASDLTLTRVGDDDFSATVTLVGFDTGTNTATFKFAGSFGSILPDGNYRATIVANDVALNSEPMTDDMALDFHVLAADANADRTVNLSDYNIMVGNFGQTGKTFAQGNFDYDPAGNVNLADYNILAANFGALLPAPPSGPGEISASVVSSNQIELTWIDNVSGESGWRVQRSTDGTNFDWYQNIVANSTSFTATGLQDGKRYWFRVRAYSDPESNSSGPNTAYTPKKAGTTLLPAPTSLSVQLFGGATASLNWLHSSQNALTAVIQRSTDGFNWTSIEQAATDSNYDDSGLLSGTRYYYRVFLKNDLIESAPSYVEYVDTL